MLTDTRIASRVVALIAEASEIRNRVLGDHVSQTDVRECRAWITSALNLVGILCPDETNPYRKRADEIAQRESGYLLPDDVYEFRCLLQALMKDIEAGLLVSIADRASAETFDDFLDHADAYLSDGRKQEAGVIAGVVFEDCLRRICRKYQESEKEINLDALISALVRIGILTATKAKRARAAAHVRTKATHAQWDEFDLYDVRASVEFTRELILHELDT